VNPEKILSGLHKEAKRRAAKSQREFDLTVDGLVKLWNQQQGCCAVTGIDFVSPNGNRHPLSPSLDRKDVAVGYTKKNVRLVCLMVNMAAFTWGLDYVDRLAITRTLVLIKKDKALYESFREKIALIDEGNFPETAYQEERILRDSTEAEGTVIGKLGLHQSWFSVRRKLGLPLPTPACVNEHPHITWRRYRMSEVLKWFKVFPETKKFDPIAAIKKEELRQRMNQW